MAANDTLITAAEVIKFSPGDKHSASQMMGAHILNIEENLFRKCIGYEFYKTLLADKAVYPSSAYTSFVKGANYNVNDIVLFSDGSLYKCILAVNNAQTPLDTTYFEPAPKFATEANEYLWCRYLRTLLAYTVSFSTVIYRAISETDQGVIRKKQETFEPAAMVDVFKLKEEYSTDIRNILSNMDAYVMDNAGSYPTYGKVMSACCTKTDDCVRRKQRNYGFNISSNERRPYDYNDYNDY